MAESDWMANYQNQRLGEMHLPGSHDAGTAKNYIDLTKMATNSNSATQDLTILEQLRAGTRFFDLRLKEKGGRVVAHHTTAGQGAYSTQSVDDVLASAARWCKRHPTEVAIFRISHTSLSTNVHQIVKASCAGSLHTGGGNLCNKTLGTIVSEGGGLVCILDEAKFGSQINQAQGIHSYTKYRAGAVNNHGISACGCYSGTHKLSEVVGNGLKGQYLHNTAHNPQRHDHLWQVYWQKTYVNPASTTGIESGTTKAFKTKGHAPHGGTHGATDHLIKLMKGLRAGKEDYVVEKEQYHRSGLRKVVDRPAVMFSTLPVRNFTLPNIISYDFVNEAVNRKIIALNEPSFQSMEDVDF
jgi:hypothetical protein